MRRCVGVCILLALAAVGVWRYRPAQTSSPAPPDPILDRRLPTFKFDGTVEEAIQLVSRQTRLVIRVNRLEFAEDFGNPCLDNPVHLDLRDVTPRQVLAAIQQQSMGWFSYSWDGSINFGLQRPANFSAARMYHLDGALAQLFASGSMNRESADLFAQCLGLLDSALVGQCIFARPSLNADDSARRRLTILRDWLAGDHAAGAAPGLRLDGSVSSAEIQRRLRQPVTEFSCDNTVEDAFAALGRQLGVNIMLNARSMEAAGVDMQQTINIRLRNSTGTEALDEMLRQLEQGEIELGWCEREGLVTIPNDRPQVWVYDVRDLVEGVRTNNGHPIPAMNLADRKGTPDELVAEWANWVVVRESYAGYDDTVACIAGRLFVDDEPQFHRKLLEALHAVRAKAAEGKP